MSLEATERRRLDTALLNLATRDVDRVLRRDNVVFLDLVYLLNKAGELVIRLDEHLLLRLLILA